MESRIETFKAYESLSMENSFMVVKEQEDIELQVVVAITDEDGGWFELYDTESGGDEWYAEGGLRFEDGKLVDYDGVFALPVCIIQRLQNMGIDTSEVE